MRHREIWATGMLVSEIGLGCEHLQGKDYNVVKAVIDEAEAAGINIMDVFMSEPQVRTDIGKAISKSRDKWVIQGHFGSIWKDGQYAKSRDLDEIKHFFDDLLTRLQTDYIDIGMLHFVDTEEDFSAIFETGVIDYVLGLKKKGVIKCIGLSSHVPHIAKKAVLTGLVEVLMFNVNPAHDMLPSTGDLEIFHANVLNDAAINGIHQDRKDLYIACEKMGCAITTMKTYCGGIMLNEKTSPFGEAIHPHPLIHYALTRPAVVSAIIGCVNPDEVRQAAGYNPETGDNDFTGLLTRAPKFSVRGVCIYCSHCLPCRESINIALVNRCLDLAGSESAVSQYKSMAKSARDCVSCGECEERCPFGVPIRERMTEAKDIFGK